MWIFVLYSLMLVHGTLAEVDCSKDAFRECGTPALFTFVPTDVLEYNRLCPQLTAFLRCLKEFQDKCPEFSNIFGSLEEYNGMYGAFNDVCEEGTFLNRVATENLRCFNETFSTTSCPEKMKAVTGPYRSPAEDTENENSYTLPIAIMCLQDILEADCLTSEFGKNCGREALEAAVEFFRRTYYIEDTCGKKNAEYLLKNLDEYKMDQEQKALVVAVLEKVIISAKESK